MKTKVAQDDSGNEALLAAARAAVARRREEAAGRLGVSVAKLAEAENKALVAKVKGEALEPKVARLVNPKQPLDLRNAFDVLADELQDIARADRAEPVHGLQEAPRDDRPSLRGIVLGRLVRALWKRTHGRAVLASVLPKRAIVRLDVRELLEANPDWNVNGWGGTAGVSFETDWDDKTATKLRATWSKALDNGRNEGGELLRVGLRVLGVPEGTIKAKSRKAH